MNTSQKGINLITKWEGLRLEKYFCQAKKPTIGYGHVILQNENIPDKITKEQAIEILKKDVQRFERAIEKNVKVPLTQNQFDALVCFLVNTGEGGIINSGVQRELNAGNYANVPSKMAEWRNITVNGVKQVSQGLVNRRKEEGELFVSQSVDVIPVQTSEPAVKWSAESLKLAQLKLLNLKLYVGKVDGVWGPKTEAAVRAYSINSGLTCGSNPKVEIPAAFYNQLLKS
jgi:lysozyme